jgi:nitrile hydratase accessory protein
MCAGHSSFPTTAPQELSLPNRSIRLRSGLMICGQTRDARISSTSTFGKATLTRPETDKFAPLARHDDEPVFDEPWQAQALGLAFVLAERGIYSPAEWSNTLGAMHRKLLDGGADDTPQTYYDAVVQALERLIGETDSFTGAMIEDRVSDWRRAYLNTPHGKPVNLSAGQTRASSEKKID